MKGFAKFMSTSKWIIPVTLMFIAMLACSISQIPQATPTNEVKDPASLQTPTLTVQPTITATQRPYPTRTSTVYFEQHETDELYATDPDGFELASGQLQLIELFAFW